jgi:hypothetical protein
MGAITLKGVASDKFKAINYPVSEGLLHGHILCYELWLHPIEGWNISAKDWEAWLNQMVSPCSMPKLCMQLCTCFCSICRSFMCWAICGPDLFSTQSDKHFSWEACNKVSNNNRQADRQSPLTKHINFSCWYKFVKSVLISIRLWYWYQFLRHLTYLQWHKLLLSYYIS